MPTPRLQSEPRSPLSQPQPKPQPIGPPRLLRFPAVRARTGLSRSTIWRLERRGAFPRHRRISPNAVAWLEQDVSEWIESKVNTTV
jgi:prophage regulatory protein